MSSIGTPQLPLAVAVAGAAARPFGAARKAFQDTAGAAHFRLLQPHAFGRLLEECGAVDPLLQSPPLSLYVLLRLPLQPRIKEVVRPLLHLNHQDVGVPARPSPLPLLKNPFCGQVFNFRKGGDAQHVPDVLLQHHVPGVPPQPFREHLGRHQQKQLPLPHLPLGPQSPLAKPAQRPPRPGGLGTR